MGKSDKLTAVVKPDNATDKSITWSSSDENVAKVDQSGNVTAVNRGTATITSETSNGKTAACTVTVEESDARTDADQENDKQVTNNTGYDTTKTGSVKNTVNAASNTPHVTKAVSSQPVIVSSPQTGDRNSSLWIILAGASTAALGTAIVMKKKKKSKKQV